MNTRKLPTRHRAVAMQLAADIDGRCVEMRILTDTGEAIAVLCPRDSIFAIQRHIEQIGRECPQIATWGRRRAEPDCPIPTVADAIARRSA